MPPDCKKLAHGRLNFSSSMVTDDVKESLKKITNAPPDFADFYTNLENIVEDIYAACVASGVNNAAGKSLDLIAHSTSEQCFLQLGGWTIQADAQSQTTTVDVFTELQNPLKLLNVTRIRLLGCSTAVTDAGQATIAALSNLGLPVFGTNCSVYSADFGPNGFIDGIPTKLAPPTPSVKMALSLDQILRPDAPRANPFGVESIHPLPAQQLAGWRYVSWPRLRLVEPLDAQSSDTLVKLIGPGRSMPGLLTEPAVEYWLPAGPPSQFRVLQILFDWRAIRVYGEALVPKPDLAHAFVNSACYGVKDPKALRRLLSGLRTEPALLDQSDVDTQRRPRS